MRLALALLLLSTPAGHAWEFTPGPICVLTHEEPGAKVVLTHDPAVPRFTIALTKGTAWPDAPVFGMTFDGPAGLTISTNRHVLSEDGRTLSTADRGFDNVLNGLAFNTTATAFTGGAQMTVSLDGAAGPVAAFAACAPQPSV